MRQESPPHGGARNAGEVTVSANSTVCRSAPVWFLNADSSGRFTIALRGPYTGRAAVVWRSTYEKIPPAARAQHRLTAPISSWRLNGLEMKRRCPSASLSRTFSRSSAEVIRRQRHRVRIRARARTSNPSTSACSPQTTDQAPGHRALCRRPAPNPGTRRRATPQQQVVVVDRRTLAVSHAKDQVEQRKIVENAQRRVSLSRFAINIEHRQVSGGRAAAPAFRRRTVLTFCAVRLAPRQS
jgi:hypothetical protein